jgi:restriction endonuclease S subunit
MSAFVTTLPLENCLDALIDYRGKTPVKTDSGIPLITAKIIKGGRIETPTEFIAKDEYVAWMRRGMPKEGDVVLTVEAPLGEVAQLGPEKIALAQRVVTLRGKAGLLDSTYLLYLLQTEEMQSQLKSRATGTTVLGIKQSELRKVTLSLPSFDLQLSAAATLKALDDRITLLRETNATLEAIAQALFKSWFVDFDPVRAKLEGRAPEGMDEATAQLFPDSFEESELGLVPRGWRNVSLKDAVSIHDSKRIPLSGQEREKRKGTYPYYGAAALMDAVDDYIFDGVYLLTGEDGSVADTNGYPIMQYVWGKFWVNNHAHILQGKDGVSTEHVMLAMQRMNITPYITGAVQAKLSQTNMWRINFLMPTREVAEHFGSLLEPLFVRFRHNSEQAKTLATLRDTLLPRLISGQLRLPEEVGSK